MIPEKADNDRHSGISLIHEFLRFRPKPSIKLPMSNYNSEKADYILRFEGLDGYNKYLDLFTPEEPETNIPILQIFETEKDLIECITSCQYHEKDKEDVAEFEGDDPFDMLRYLVKASKIYLVEALKMQEELKKLDEIEKSRETTGDMNAYYMKMMKFENDKKKNSFRVARRIH